MYYSIKILTGSEEMSAWPLRNARNQVKCPQLEENRHILEGYACNWFENSCKCPQELQKCLQPIEK